ncbi:MAG: transposase [Desulfobacterales bacterium]
MARQLRIQYPGAYYHVTSRGNERQDIYKDSVDYDIFLDKLTASLDIYNVSLLAYVCMTNHFHLFVTTPDGNLSEFMRHFNISYTSAFNRRHERSGHLYQGRYKSFLIDADNYLMAVSRYIHLNPVRIKTHSDKPLSEKIKLLDEHRHSSFPGYIRLNARVDFINYRETLNCFGGDTPNGRRQYRQFVYKGLTENLEGLSEIGKKTGFIGSSHFKKDIRQAHLNTKSDREQPQSKVFRVIFKPEDLIRNFCQIINADEHNICRRGRNTVDRAVLMELLYRFCDIKQPEIGRLLGGLDYSAVSIARKRLRLRMEKDLSLKQKVDDITNKLSSLKI